MTILSKPLRRQLETAIRQARDIAEVAVREAIARIGVADADAPSHLSDANRALRRRLRAHGRTLGDTRAATGTMTTGQLQDATAYEIWHRMLFGRFLVERGLLIHPDIGAAVSVSELRDLAKDEGAADEWVLAERYAAPGLPGVFKPDDPVLALQIAPEFSKRLRAILSNLPEDIFEADDSLGWTYQFWRSSEKEAINAAGGKIGASELPSVTQLFTESYMVKFLLHNTLGAWWAGKVLSLNTELARDAADEKALREACALPGVDWEFLRFRRDDHGKGTWRPAAGTFPGWSKPAAEVTYCDPCCGSGHFLVEAFFILAALRQKEEGLSADEATVAVLRDNLHGLELDGRCVQIAAFNVALAAWKLVGKPILLPTPHIAWVGAPPPMTRVEMAQLANDDLTLRGALERLHDQFAQAPVLGSLIELGAQDLLDSDLRERGEAALDALHSAEPETAEGTIAALGLLDASELLRRKYTLIVTNVPFLTEIKFSDYLDEYIGRKFNNFRHNLATVFLQKCLLICKSGGSVGIVSPQIWLYSKRYGKTRNFVNGRYQGIGFFRIGPKAFHHPDSNGESISLNIISNNVNKGSVPYISLDASKCDSIDEKEEILRSADLSVFPYPKTHSELTAPLAVNDDMTEVPISSLANGLVGITTSDSNRFILKFWEVRDFGSMWEPLQSSVGSSMNYGGRSDIVLWERENGQLATLANSLRHVNHIVQNWRRGKPNWGKIGISISQMAPFRATIYDGNIYDSNCCSIIPLNPSDLPALWSFVLSGEFQRRVESLIGNNRKAEVGNLLSVGIEINHWRDVAEIDFPEGLARPCSNDPTQWLFHGHPAFADAGTELHVALARVAGYRWPVEKNGAINLSDLAKERVALARALLKDDPDGLLPLFARSSESSLADQMRELLATAYGSSLSIAREQDLIRAADLRLDKKEARDTSLEGWLADRAFRQHCVLFQQRPFLWQIWDGMKDGFSAFLNYHLLGHAALDKLTYTLLGDWIRTAKAERNTARTERAERLQQMLAKIIEGETPFDIFVRWKSAECQPVGWQPDFDDGVRLNIRPFMTAAILREQPRGISWNKDRGADVSSAPWFDLGAENGGKQGDRINDHHTTLAQKLAARGTS